MKKYFYILASVFLLLALLVSCNTPTPPTESTPESTGTVDPVESTTSEPTSSSEPSVVTSEAPSVETDPPVTDPPVTEVFMTLWDSRLMNPEIRECELPSPSDEAVKITLTENVWHFTMWKPYKGAEIASLAVPEEKQDLALKVPLTYECEMDGIGVKVEFFEEYYLLSEHIPVRVTIENQTENIKRFPYMAYYMDMSIYDGDYYITDFKGCGSKDWRREHVIAEVTPRYFPLAMDRIHATSSHESEFWSCEQTLELFPKGTDPESLPGSKTGQSPDATYFDYAAGYYSFEYLLAPKADLVEFGEQYVYVFHLTGGGDFFGWVVEIPVEVVKVEVVEN